MKSNIERMYDTLIMASRYIEGSIKAGERYGKVMGECRALELLNSDGSFKNFSEINL